MLCIASYFVVLGLWISSTVCRGGFHIWRLHLRGEGSQREEDEVWEVAWIVQYISVSKCRLGGAGSKIPKSPDVICGRPEAPRVEGRENQHEWFQTRESLPTACAKGNLATMRKQLHWSKKYLWVINLTVHCCGPRWHSSHNKCARYTSLLGLPFIHCCITSESWTG